MDSSKWSLLKRAVKKMKVLLLLNVHRWRLACIVGASSSSRMLSFHDRPGLRAAAYYDQDQEEETTTTTTTTSSYNFSGSSRRLYKTASFASDSFSGSCRGLYRTTSFASSEDVDRKADMFISNFYRQLRMERQVSLQLRYCRHNSFDLASL